MFIWETFSGVILILIYCDISYDFMGVSMDILLWQYDIADIADIHPGIWWDEYQDTQGIYIWLNIPIHWLSKPLSLGRDALIDFFKCFCKIIQSTCSWDLPQWSSDHQWWMTGKQKVISLMPSDPPVTHPLFSALYLLIWFHVTNVGRTIINHPPNHHK